MGNKNARWMERYRTDPEFRAKALARNRACRNPKRESERKIFRLYGLTPRDIYFMTLGQGGSCKVCKRSPAGKGCCAILHVDHDHTKQKGEPGFIRGLLCDQCNKAIGHAKDSAERLRALAAYVEQRS